MNKILQGFAGAALLMLVITPSQASVLQMVEFAGNECPDAFKDCYVSYEDVDISPAIVKFNSSLAISEINSVVFPDIDDSTYGSKWNFSNTTDENKTGDWEYTPTLGEDPAVRYWAAKGGNNYYLFWMAPEAACGTTYSLACLNAAGVVTSGSWFTPINGGGNQAGLSNLTFFDTATVVPVPAAFWLFGTALVGFIGFSRRTKV